MAPNEFTIYTTWDPERDSAAIHAERVRESLTELGVTCPALRNWKAVDRASGKPVPIEAAKKQLDQIVERGFVAVQELSPSPSTASFSVIGAGRRSFRGMCAAMLRFEFDGAPDQSIVAYPVFKAFVAALAPIWNATYIQAYSSAIQEHWDSPRRSLDLSWMTYLTQEFAEMISAPSDIAVEELEGGILLSAVAGEFDTNNPSHLTAAQELRDALNSINKLYVFPGDRPR